MAAKEEFIEIYQTNIHREGGEELLDYLSNKSDFFTPRLRPVPRILPRRAV